MSIPFDERFTMLVEAEWMARDNTRVARALSLGASTCTGVFSGSFSLGIATLPTQGGSRNRKSRDEIRTRETSLRSGHVAPGGMVMILIRCETGDDVKVQSTTLVGAKLSGLNLHRALLEKQDLRGADLSGSDLRSAWLDDAILDDANLSGARLPACSAARARFVRANLSGALLRSGGFEGADFTQANLQGANAGRSRMRGALLLGTDLRAIDLTEVDMTGAIADEATLWPDGFDPVSRGVRILPKRS